MRIGVDTGGTFTDCVIFAGGRAKVLKVFSTPKDSSRGIVEGVSQLARETRPVTRHKSIPRKAPPSPLVLEIIHGTTVGTNSLLERRGARVALITTAGFEDLLEIGRQARPRLYDLNVQREPPLAERALRFGVRERITTGGRVIQPLADAEIHRLVRRVKKSGADSLAVCFLFAFANPTHERRVAAALRSLGLPISISQEILPEFREFERLSTVVINAYLAPRMGTYLHNLNQRMGTTLRPASSSLPRRKITAGIWDGVPLESTSSPLAACERARIFVMQSNGGISTAAHAAEQPVRTILSGPAGGVVASAWLAEHIGLNRAISFDMGGTSTDVCLLDGAPRTTHEITLAGLPVAVPVLDVHSVGAGGGSLARIDAGGALRVGPESAGAAPGPVCYGRGGTGVTVTDANLLLGRIDAEHFLGGTFQLDAPGAQHAFVNFLARPGRQAAFASPQKLAAGIVSVSNATMEKALRVISVERGYDPRDFALICYGGAGGLHAAELARALCLPSVIIPENPGAFSALGILLSDVVRDASKSVLLVVPHREQAQWHNLLNQIDRQLAALHRQAHSALRREGFNSEHLRAKPWLDLRYRGQSYELSIPYTPRFREDFQRAHERAYGYADAARPLEIVNLRLQLSIPTPKPRWHRHKLGLANQSRQALVKTRPVWFGSKARPAGIYDRQRLAAGARLQGPAVIFEYSATTVVPPDFECRVDECLNLTLRCRPGQG